MKAFADNKLYVTKKTIFVFDRVENIVRKGEITCTSNSSFSHNVFKRLPPKSRQKVLLCWKGFRKKTKPKFEVYSVKRGLNVIAKHIDAHVIMSSPRRLTGAKLFASFKFSACRRTILHHDSLGCLSKWILWIHNKMFSCLVKSMDENNTVVSAYTLYSHLQQCCFHPSKCPLFARTWLIIIPSGLFHLLPNNISVDVIFDWSKLKEFAGDNFNATYIVQFCFDRV